MTQKAKPGCTPRSLCSSDHDEDFHHLHPDITVELVVSDFNLKPDVGQMIARDWMDKNAVYALIDMPLSRLALGLVPALEAKDKVGLMTTPATSDLAHGSREPKHLHFKSGTFCLAASLVKAAAR